MYKMSRYLNGSGQISELPAYSLHTQEMYTGKHSLQKKKVCAINAFPIPAG